MDTRCGENTLQNETWNLGTDYGGQRLEKSVYHDG